MWKPEAVIALVFVVIMLGGVFLIFFGLLFGDVLIALIDKWIERKGNNDKRGD